MAGGALIYIWTITSEARTKAINTIFGIQISTLIAGNYTATVMKIIQAGRTLIVIRSVATQARSIAIYTTLINLKGSTGTKIYTSIFV